MSSNKFCLLAAFFFCLGVSRSAIAEAPSANSFASIVLPECDSNEKNLHLDDAGSIYVTCGKLRTYFVIKFSPEGERDQRWGTKGVATFQASDLDVTCVNVVTCTPSLTHAMPARDGGFWIALAGGRVVKYLPSGLVDIAYRDVHVAGSGHAELPSQSKWRFVGAVEQPNGELMSLGITSEGAASPAIVLRALLPDGRFGSDVLFPLGAKLDASILAWSVSPAGLELVLKSDGDLATAALRRVILTPDGLQSVTDGRVLPEHRNPGFVAPSFQVLGDGAMMFATTQRIYKWRADGKPDVSFGTADEVGVRNTPSAISDCGTPFLKGQSYLSLRSGGEFAHYFSTGFRSRFGNFCERSLVSVVSDNGRTDSFTGAVPFLVGILPFRVDNAGRILFLGSSLQRIDGPGSAGTRARADVRVVEYYNPTLDHYFLTAHEHEVAFVDQGNAGADWKRTGHVFGAWNIETFIEGAETVCRYYGDLKGGPNSHFYSAEKFECDALQALDNATPLGKPAWRFERDAFRIAIPANGKCAPNLTPIYRLYNDGSAKGFDSNHRYVSSLALYAEMQAKGWVAEGLHMCSSGS